VVYIWGHAAPDEAVAVTFRGATQSTKADALGRFSVYLAPGDAGSPFDLTVKGNNRIAFEDVLVGDVWVASGQSNMEFKLRHGDNAPAEIAAAKYPKIRRTVIDRNVSNNPRGRRARAGVDGCESRKCGQRFGLSRRLWSRVTELLSREREVAVGLRPEASRGRVRWYL
jgi:sialate O-acetylesterase